MSLQDQISQLVNPAPTFLDPEDEDDEITRAKLTEKLDGFDDEDDSAARPSKLRSKKGVILADEDEKYAGRRVSRKNLDSEGSEEDSEDGDIPLDDDDVSEEIDDEEEDEEEEEFEEDEDSENEDLKGFTSSLKNAKKKFVGNVKDEENGDDDDDYDDEDEFEDNDEDSAGNDDEGDEGDDDDDEGDDDDESSGDDEDMEDDEMDEGSNIQSFSASAIEEEIEKGNAAKAQLSLWDSLLESRIKMQKALLAVNQLPQPMEWKEFTTTGGLDYEKALEQGCSLLSKLGGALLELQENLLQQNPETVSILEEEGSGRHGDAPSRKRKAGDDLESIVTKRHLSFKNYRNDTIQKWNDKTQLSSGRLSSKSFSAFNQSALKQIEQILSDKDRLVKRTQLIRSGQRTLGKVMAETGAVETSEDDQTSVPSRDHLKTYDEEAFNDDDFYHQLLRELIEKKTSDVSDPVALSRQWLEVQKMRSKVKKKVDTRASKGRKIRYDVHPKLVNFMAPHETSPWNDESKNDLFSSLYGQRHKHL